MSDPAPLRDRLRGEMLAAAAAKGPYNGDLQTIPLDVAVDVAAAYVQGTILEARRARAELTEQLHIDDPYDPYGTRRTP